MSLNNIVKHLFGRLRCTRAKITYSKGTYIGNRTKILGGKKIQLGEDVAIRPYVDLWCGGHINIGSGSEIGQQLIIKDGVGIAANAYIAVRGKVKIGKNCIFGPNVRIHSENHIFSEVDTPIKDQG